MPHFYHMALHVSMWLMPLRSSSGGERIRFSCNCTDTTVWVYVIVQSSTYCVFFLLSLVSHRRASAIPFNKASTGNKNDDMPPTSLSKINHGDGGIVSLS
mmetsp:Transcript_6628/g.11115  ORF Transcript_6628/g.11115 Transcript_6628/m.11115 type:complete len:100 (-) Transcript_6628:998-1297(-)